MNGCQQGFYSVASFGVGGQKSTSKPPQAICKPLQEFINKTEGNYYLKSANTFAKRHRAIGLEVMGWHSYLQRNMIPFEGLQAKQLTNKNFKHIRSEADIASKRLADIFGEPELLQGYGIRNTTVMAIAPTTSSSAILGQTSPGIEPFSSNYFKAGLSKGNFIRKNKYLIALFLKKRWCRIWCSA